MTVGILLSFVGAFVLGFAAHRVSLCTVKAVAEVMTARKLFVLASFIKIAIWVVALSVLALAVFGVPTPVVHWPLTGFSIIGGLLFGVGAAVNGGCTFSTLTRLGDGDLSLAATVAGWLAGAWIEKTVFAGHSPTPSLVNPYNAISSPWLILAAAAACAWLVWQVIVIIRPFPRRASLLRAVLAPNYKLSAAAALIAGANLLLYDNLGAWSFTSVVLSTAEPGKFPTTASLPLHWLVLAATFSGMIASSLLRKSFAYSRPSAKRLAVHTAGGIAMGFGAAMIPGGNDSLILYGVGFLSPHAAPAFAAILVGIALTFVAMKRFGAAPPAVYCTGDICMPAASLTTVGERRHKARHTPPAPQHERPPESTATDRPPKEEN